MYGIIWLYLLYTCTVRREYLSKRQEEQNENIDTVEADLYLLASRLCLKPGSDEENVSRVNEDWEPLQEWDTDLFLWLWWVAIMWWICNSPWLHVTKLYWKTIYFMK